jgi:DNA ligase-1
MKGFTELYHELDATTKTLPKVEALTTYFLSTEPEDSIWAIALLVGNRPKRPIKTGDLKTWAMELAHVPDWLFDDSYSVVGDLAETITLLINSKSQEVSELSLNELMREFEEIARLSDSEKKERVLSYWKKLSPQELYIFNKLITGAFRVGVSKLLVFKALAKAYHIDEKVIAHRFIGNWKPTDTSLLDLLKEDEFSDSVSRPYPFCLAYALDVDLSTLGNIHDWQIERKYDGIRGQIIVRHKELFVWSRGEELLTDKFPEFEELRNYLPDGTVIDGEILPIVNGDIKSFNQMQKRTTRKALTKKILQDIPLEMVCYDLLEKDGKDLRDLPLQERRKLLEEVVTHSKAFHSSLILAPLLSCDAWEHLDTLRNEAKTVGCEGLMLKRKDSNYETGRKRGKWWKWKVDPYSIDAVLIYAQAGHGRRANLFTDYTFAVWDGDVLVPFTKAYSGLTDKEIFEVDNWVKKNTIEKFGPVRSVTPHWVFEIAFEGINESPRHKSGIALRFPRISRWRKDKPLSEANTKQDLLNLLHANR